MRSRRSVGRRCRSRGGGGNAVVRVSTRVGRPIGSQTRRLCGAGRGLGSRSWRARRWVLVRRGVAGRGRERIWRSLGWSGDRRSPGGGVVAVEMVFEALSYAGKEVGRCVVEVADDACLEHRVLLGGGHGLQFLGGPHLRCHGVNGIRPNRDPALSSRWRTGVRTMTRKNFSYRKRAYVDRSTNCLHWGLLGGQNMDAGARKRSSWTRRRSPHRQ